jgi:uncharacterized C2H2 Zn-finger protein
MGKWIAIGKCIVIFKKYDEYSKIVNSIHKFVYGGINETEE